MTELFLDIDNYTFLELIVLRLFVSDNYSKYFIDNAYMALNYYLSLDLDSNLTRKSISEFEEIRLLVRKKYNCRDSEVVEILKYYLDEKTNRKLISIIRFALKEIDKKFIASYSSLYNNRIIKENVFEFQDRGFKVLLPYWLNNVCKNYELSNKIDKLLEKRLNGEAECSSKLKVNKIERVKEIKNSVAEKSKFDNENIAQSIDKNTSPQKTKNQNNKYSLDSSEENKYKSLRELHYGVLSHMKDKKGRFVCFEQVFDYLSIDKDKYSEYHNVVLEYVAENGLKDLCERYPLSFILVVVYCAVYEYNMDGSSGYWTWLGLGNGASTTSRVINCLDKWSDKFALKSYNRENDGKKNIMKILSHIYIPQKSLKNIYNNFYIYYKSDFVDIHDKDDFLLHREDRLDKSAVFFLSNDPLFPNAFNDTLDLFDKFDLEVSNLEDSGNLPPRFLEYLKKWDTDVKNSLVVKRNFKTNAQIKINDLYGNIYVYLPEEKSVKDIYNSNWNIICDGELENIDTNIIEYSSYSLTESNEFEIGECNEVKTKFFMNDKEELIKEFIFDKNYIIFDSRLKYIKHNSDSYKRDFSFIGIKGESDFLSNYRDFVLEEIQIDSWTSYKFYWVDFTKFLGDEIVLSKNETIKLIDMPVVDNSSGDLLFKNSFDSQVDAIYKNYGPLVLSAPYIRETDIEIELLSYVNDEVKQIKDWKAYKDGLDIKIDFNLSTAYYSLKIKYKGKNCFVQKFFVDKETWVSCNVFENNKKMDLKISRAGDKFISISSTDNNTSIIEHGTYYELNSTKASMEFEYFQGKRKCRVKNIVKENIIELRGLDNYKLNHDEDDVPELTKSLVKNNNDISIFVRNLDKARSRQNDGFLYYKLRIVDLDEDEPVCKQEKKIKFSDSHVFSIRNCEIKDSKLLKCFISVEMNYKEVFNKDIFYILDNIKVDKIEDYSFDDKVKFYWEESEENKNRILRLSNLINPLSEVKEYELEDEITFIDIDKMDLDYGLYKKSLDYKNKRNNPFKSKKIIFSTSDDFKNKPYHSKVKGENKLLEIMSNFYINKTDARYKILKSEFRRVDFKEEHKFENLILIIQVFLYEIQAKNINDKSLLTMHKLIKRFLDAYGEENIIQLLINEKDRFREEDFNLAFNFLMASRKRKMISKSLLNKFVAISPLWLIMSCKSNLEDLSNDSYDKLINDFFDEDLLTGSPSEIIEKVFSNIENEEQKLNAFTSKLFSQERGRNKKSKINMYNTNYRSTMKNFQYFIDEEGLEFKTILDSRLSDIFNVDDYNFKVDSLPFFRSKRMKEDKYSKYEKCFKGSDFDNFSAYKICLSNAFVFVFDEEIDESKRFSLFMQTYFSKHKKLFDRCLAYMFLLRICEVEE